MSSELPKQPATEYMAGAAEKEVDQDIQEMVNQEIEKGV
jgi:hypothetical protein